jgi:hypothetical protein
MIAQVLLVIIRIQTDFRRKAGLFSVFFIRIVYVAKIILLDAQN